MAGSSWPFGQGGYASLSDGPGNACHSPVADLLPGLDHPLRHGDLGEGTERLVIQLKLIGRADPADIGTLLPALTEAANRCDVDHTRLAATLEWVQYRKNFRSPVMVRPFQSTPQDSNGHEGPLAEIAIDARRAKDMDRAELVDLITDRLQKALGIIPDVHQCLHLETWVRPSKSVMWSFNRAYWRHLAAWDSTFQKDYASALPGGVSDGTNPDFWRTQIETFVDSLDRLDAWSELPDEIHVLELGVGDGEQALVWLDTFSALCRERGRDYLSRVRYLMADYSPHVLERASERVKAYAAQVEGIELDFRNPMNGLEHLQQKVLFAHTCNLYDNLPTDEIMRVGDAAYEPLVRASITPPEVDELSSKHGVSGEEIIAKIQGIIRNGPDSMPRSGGGRCTSGPTCGMRSTSRRSTSRSPRRRRCVSRRPPRRTWTCCWRTCPTGRACTARRSRWRASRRRCSSCTTRA